MVTFKEYFSQTKLGKVLGKAKEAPLGVRAIGILFYILFFLTIPRGLNYLPFNRSPTYILISILIISFFLQRGKSLARILAIVIVPFAFLLDLLRFDLDLFSLFLKGFFTIIVCFYLLWDKNAKEFFLREKEREFSILKRSKKVKSPLFFQLFSISLLLCFFTAILFVAVSPFLVITPGGAVFDIGTFFILYTILIIFLIFCVFSVIQMMRGKDWGRTFISVLSFVVLFFFIVLFIVIPGFYESGSAIGSSLIHVFSIKEILGIILFCLLIPLYLFFDWKVKYFFSKKSGK